MNLTTAVAGPAPLSTRASHPVRTARPSPARPRPTGPLRLTRRGRAAVVGTVLAGSLAAGLSLSQRPSQAAGEAGSVPRYAYVVVQPGQTMWEIARGIAPGTDPRVTIDRIRDLNALDGVDIRAGQRIALP